MELTAPITHVFRGPLRGRGGGEMIGEKMWGEEELMEMEEERKGRERSFSQFITTAYTIT